MLRICMTYFSLWTGMPPNGMTYWGLKKISPKKRIALTAPKRECYASA